MAASTNIIRAAKKAMFTAIQQDYKSVVAKLGKVREPRLEIIVAANDSQSLELVCMKQKLLDKAGFKSTVKLLDNGMDLGWLKEKLAQSAMNPVVDGILIQYPLPAGFPQDLRVIDGLIPERKNVDAIFSKQSDWKSLPEKYLTDDCTMRAVPSIAAHMLLSIAAPKSAFSDAILIGEDPINMAPLKSFLQAYMESENDFEFQHPVVVITCLNRPRAINISRLPEGSVVLDFGYSNDGSTFVGDTDWHLAGSNSSNTTVFAAPSGPNSLLSHCLLRNLYVSWKRSLLG